MMKQGVLFGVGTGPGDPLLITVKALNVLRQCPVVSFPRGGRGGREGADKASAFEIAREALPELSNKELLPLELPMTRDAGLLRAGREKAAAAVRERLSAGKDVAFLTLGDPSIYSTFGYLRMFIKRDGFETRVIPGIPSFCAAAAALDEDLALWEEPLHIIPASCGDLAGAVTMTGTRVLMKSGSALGEVRALLDERGLSAKTRVVENCGMAGERVWKSLDSLHGETPGYFSLLIIKEEGRA